MCDQDPIVEVENAKLSAIKRLNLLAIHFLRPINLRQQLYDFHSIKQAALSTTVQLATTLYLGTTCITCICMKRCRSECMDIASTCFDREGVIELWQEQSWDAGSCGGCKEYDRGR